MATECGAKLEDLPLRASLSIGRPYSVRRPSDMSFVLFLAAVTLTGAAAVP